MRTMSCLITRSLILGGLLCAWSMNASSQPLRLKADQYKRIHQAALEGIVQGKVEETREALKDYEKASPRDIETQYMLAACYARLDQPQAAVEALHRAQEYGLPPGRIAAGATNMLAPLRAYAAFEELLAAEPQIVHGPMLGQVTGTSAVFWLRLKALATVVVRAWEPGHADTVLTSGRFQVDTANGLVALVWLDGLKPGTEYQYEVLVDGEPQPAPATLSFRTAPAADAESRFTVAFGGGAGYTPDHERIWTTIRGRAPDAFFFMGDNIYPDAPEMPEMQQYSYFRRQSRPEYRRFIAATPIYAIWDDHDFGTNDCWGGPAIDEPAWKPEVWRRYRQHWVNPAYGGGEAQPGVWFKWAIDAVDFFFLDGRYYRTDPRAENASMLGPVQLQWLLDALEQSTATFKVICTPVPFVSGTKGGSLDTWDGFPLERARILEFLEAHNIEGVLILSADRHRSDVWRIPRENAYDLYEFESSRLTNIHKHEELDDALFSYNDKQSFGLLTFDTGLEDPQVSYEIVSIDDESVHTFTVKRSELE